MIRGLTLKAKTAKPAIGKVRVNLFAEAALRANAATVANDQHADHQFRINRRAARRTVKIPQMFAHTGQVNKAIYGSKKVIVRNVSLKAEAIKQSFLFHHPFTHHRNTPRSIPMD
jgi:hypothetical protein